MNDEIWIRFDKTNPEEIFYFFIPEIKMEKNRKRVYARIIATNINMSTIKVGTIRRINAKWAKQVTRKLETHEVIKYKLLGML